MVEYLCVSSDMNLSFHARGIFDEIAIAIDPEEVCFERWRRARRILVLARAGKRQGNCPEAPEDECRDILPKSGHPTAPPRHRSAVENPRRNLAQQKVTPAHS